MQSRSVVGLVVLGAAALLGDLLGPQDAGLPRTAAEPRPAARDDQELVRLFTEDQADRTPASGRPIDWSTVLPRDRAREARIKELYRSDALQTGADYYHAAMILQHAPAPEDYLLAHEFCVVAASKGEKRALWLAAATEDRFLMRIGRPQRFGTQYQSEDGTKPVRLYRVDEGMTDGLRRSFGVPPLAEAMDREPTMNQTGPARPGTSPPPPDVGPARPAATPSRLTPGMNRAAIAQPRRAVDMARAPCVTYARQGCKQAS
jgi:hypothetical protein